MKKKFGKRVAAIVTGASEPDYLRKGKDEKTSWLLRKQHTLEYIANEAAPEQLLVICADKLDNITAIHNDYKRIGNELWKRFNAPKADQQWYYTALAAAIEKRSKDFGETLTELSKMLTQSVNEIFWVRD